MISYGLTHADKSVSVHMNKDYRLQVKRNDKQVSIQKEMCYAQLIDANDKCDADPYYSLNGHVLASDIYAELTNLKHIGFEVTDSCNLKCTYCIYGKFYDNHDIRTNKKIDSKKAKLLIDFLVDKLKSPVNTSSENEVIISFYGGEPLLNVEFIKDIIDYTQRLQNHHVTFKYMMTTNAIYLKKYLDFILKYHFIVTVSLDGAEENDAYRSFPNGKTSFKIVYDTLKYLQNYHPNYFRDYVRINSVIHNLNNQQEVFSFIYHEFGKVPHFSTVNRTGVKLGMKEEFDKLAQPKPINEELTKEMVKILDLGSNKANILQSFIFHYCGNVYESYNDLLIKNKNVEHLPTSTCMPFSRRIFMTVNNIILPCERIGHQYALGEVKEDEVVIDCEDIARKYNTYYDSLRGLCMHCFNKRHCVLCMFDISNLGKKPICKQMADKRMFKEYLRKNIEILANQPNLYNRIMKEIILVR
ncbi:MAG: GTP 3',8-cyclase [Parabacteroides distasonis]